MYVDIILPLAIPNYFTYGVPLEFQAEMEIGKRVEIGFGRGKKYSGLVRNIHDKKPELYAVKPILAILDKNPIVFEYQFTFWEWLASYYMCSVGEVMQAALPAYLKLESECYISLNKDADINHAELSDDEYLIIEALEQIK